MKSVNSREIALGSDRCRTATRDTGALYEKDLRRANR